MKCIKGEVYVDAGGRIFKYYGDRKKYLYVNPFHKRIYINNNNQHPAEEIFLIATDFEKEWLSQCTKKGNFIHKEDIVLSKKIIDNYDMY